MFSPRLAVRAHGCSWILSTWITSRQWWRCIKPIINAPSHTRRETFVSFTFYSVKEPHSRYRLCPVWQPHQARSGDPVPDPPHLRLPDVSQPSKSVLREHPRHRAELQLEAGGLQEQRDAHPPLPGRAEYFAKCAEEKNIYWTENNSF